ncbi:SepA family multidrug efflux transporter [Viridibacillus sp. YIM B01967]|jgi:hypothetical protein|uniref:SepA family multidrug efflux transporter n=1 Tax=Viridibacillus soli TaxID=2798301 RepID=A0ABS1H900_9BACL|nr:SepA family multidrug efflux transporter [Viridibacillus soli]MBK3495894.1 SepA family multidrug efflux transporter [Viridibacillus soli]
MFKNRKIKIRVSGWSALLILIAILMIALVLVVTVPLFGFYGLYNVFAKYDLAAIQIFEQWYRNGIYFGWFLLLIAAMMFIVDFINLFVVASLNLPWSKPVAVISYAIQTAVCATLFKGLLVMSFSRIEVTWTGSIILFVLLYIIVAVFSYEKPEPPKNSD